VTKYSPYGPEIENKDALGKYSSAVFGYNHSLAKAVAKNAQYNQIAFDGFEDYAFINQGECCKGQFDFYDNLSHIVQTESHTGRYSMELQRAPSTVTSYVVSTERPLKVTDPVTLCTGGACDDDMPYTVKPIDINGEFGPQIYDVPSGSVGTEYIASYWIKQSSSTNERMFDYPDVQMNIYVGSGGTPPLRVPTSIKKGKVIDGWQLVEYRFSMLSTDVGNIRIEFENSNASRKAYVDDVRIQPFHSSLKSFVYDPVTLRLWAELDERNFATFYEYDEEGALIRVKKETEKGIMTVQESRSSNVKN
jgi:hypothetical protein